MLRISTHFHPPILDKLEQFPLTLRWLGRCARTTAAALLRGRLHVVHSRRVRHAAEKGWGAVIAEVSTVGIARIPEGAKAVSEGRRLYLLLRQELTAAHCFEISWGRSAGMMILVLAVAMAAYAALLTGPGWPIRLLLCGVTAIANVQGGFIGHEAGHMSITLRPRLAALYGRIFLTALTGVTYAHFQNHHRRHHLHTNVFEFDPDIRCEASSVCPESVQTKKPLGLWITAYQAQLFWPWISLLGFAAKIDSFLFCLRNLRRTQAEQAVLLLHIILWFILPGMLLGFRQAGVNYALWTLFAGPYLAAVFYINHIGAENIDTHQEISFLHHQLATSRNIAGGPLRNILFGGLNHHIEHHLFPTISKWKLPVARSITHSFCHRHGLEYREVNWLNAVGELLGQLRAMALLAQERRCGLRNKKKQSCR